MQTHSFQNWLSVVRRGLTDLWFILSIAAAVLLFIVLFGYHATDPGWSTSGENIVVQHWLGISGAYVADTLFSLFGYASYLIPIGLLAIGWQSARREYLDAELMVWKSVGLIVSLLALCGILTFHCNIRINSLSVTGGGLLGQKFSAELLKIWTIPMIMGLYTLLLVVGITLLLEIRWFGLLEKIGYPILQLLSRFSSKPQEIAIEEEEYAVQTDNPDDKRHALLNRLKGKPISQSENESNVLKRQEPVLSEFAESQQQTLANEFDFVASTKPGEQEVEPSAINWQEFKQEPSLFTQTAKATPASFTEETYSSSSVSAKSSESVENIFDDYDAFGEQELSSSASGFSSIHTTNDEDAYLAAIQGDDEDVDDYSEINSQETEAEHLKVRLNNSSSLKENAFYRSAQPDTYHLPSLSLLKVSPLSQLPDKDSQFEILAPLVESALSNYRLDVRVVDIAVGPVVTRLELELAPGIKVSQISSLDKDLARSLSVQRVRVVDVIPGKPYIGLEIPNKKREIVHLRDVLESKTYQEQKSPLTLVLGSDISGQPVVTNLAKMPHLLVAGTTGSGKSVAINVMLASMLFKAKPDELKLILVDPKMLEMSMYEDIPHLLTPVVTDMNDAENALRWAVAEMERRYQLMAAFKVRNIANFNQTIREMQARSERIDDPLWRAEDHIGLAHQPPQITPLPYIVIVIDELADMMMAVGKKVEELIARIAQKARAAGIHLILATQRPSVDVITGLIKANVPTRLAFQVSSKIDSRTIIDQQGAEALLGHGDGLFVPPGSSAPRRVHGAFIEDGEVDALTSYIKTQAEPQYEDSITNPVPASAMGALGAMEKSDDPEQDPLYDEACQIVIETGKASISYLQRRLQIGYNRSARIIEAMEAAGLVSPAERGQRKVLRGNDDDNY